MARKTAKFLIRSAAREDILRQHAYYLLEKDAPAVAARFLDSLQSEIEKLCKAPGVGAPKYLTNPILSGLRSWPIAGFPAMRIYYLYTEDVVRIVRVLHGKRDIPALLKNEPAGDE